MNMKAADFPLLDLTVEDFRLQERAMGRLEAVARGAPQGLMIESLQLSHPDSVFRMSGLWRDSGISETRADLSLSVLDAGKFLTRFGFPDTLKRGSADIQATPPGKVRRPILRLTRWQGNSISRRRQGSSSRSTPGWASCSAC